MPRDSNIPMFLWIATAVLAHLLWGGGADRAARMLEETLDIRRFAAEVQRRAHETGGPIEVSLIEDAKPIESPVEPPPLVSPQDVQDPADEAQSDERAPDQDTKQQKQRKNEPTQPDKRAEPPKIVVPVVENKKEEEKQAEQVPEPDHKKRIAVRQHVDDPNQKDNPEAELIADQANHVAEQTQARVTSTDQNDKNPTPGQNYAGPSDNPGNAYETRVAQSEDRPGEADRAPNETTGAPQHVAAKPVPAQAGEPTAQPSEPGSREHKGAASGADARVAKNDPAQKGQQAHAETRAEEGSPETLTAPGGAFSTPEQRQATRPERARAARKRRLPPPRRRPGYADLLGFGSRGTTDNGVNLNLDPTTAVASIGRDVLARERRADAERRLSAHRGSWTALGIERWRAAIENYVPSVKPGNQTALNTARVPFATYLNTIHNRIHPIFADSFLASLDSLPGSHPMNRPDMSTNLEIVLDREEGRVVRMGVTKTSGVTAFDIAALESVQRASPFGTPPREIVSPDGNVYFHWEFWRNPYYACSTYFARPYILKVKPKEAPPNVEPPSSPPFYENGGPERDRHGSVPRLTGERQALR
jgi:hypothetical protein